jgi:hypothetical protein
MAVAIVTPPLMVFNKRTEIVGKIALVKIPSVKKK